MRRVLGRLTGRVPFPAEDTDQSSTTNLTGSTSVSGITDNAGTTISEGTANRDGSTIYTGSPQLDGTTSKSDSARIGGSTTNSGATARRTSVKLPKTGQVGIAPERDFQRVPNSVTREAMAAGLFRASPAYLAGQSRP